MSVLKNKRGRQQFAVYTKSIELAKHSIQLCSSENNFPKKYRWLLTSDIVKLAQQIPVDIMRANQLNPNHSAQEYIRRQELQDEASGKCDALLVLLDIAKKVTSLSWHQIEYWTGLVVGVQDSIGAWRDSDKKRFGKPKTPEAEIEELKEEIQQLKSKMD